MNSGDIFNLNADAEICNSNANSTCFATIPALAQRLSLAAGICRNGRGLVQISPAAE